MTDYVEDDHSERVNKRMGNTKMKGLGVCEGLGWLYLYSLSNLGAYPSWAS